MSNYKILESKIETINNRLLEQNLYWQLSAEYGYHVLYLARANHGAVVKRYAFKTYGDGIDLLSMFDLGMDIQYNIDHGKGVI